jgi:hypothetical protein
LLFPFFKKIPPNHPVACRTRSWLQLHIGIYQTQQEHFKTLVISMQPLVFDDSWMDETCPELNDFGTYKDDDQVLAKLEEQALEEQMNQLSNDPRTAKKFSKSPPCTPTKCNQEKLSESSTLHEDPSNELFVHPFGNRVKESVSPLNEVTSDLQNISINEQHETYDSARRTLSFGKKHSPSRFKRKCEIIRRRSLSRSRSSSGSSNSCSPSNGISGNPNDDSDMLMHGGFSLANLSSPIKTKYSFLGFRPASKYLDQQQIPI